MGKRAKKRVKNSNWPDQSDNKTANPATEGSLDLECPQMGNLTQDAHRFAQLSSL